MVIIINTIKPFFQANDRILKPLTPINGQVAIRTAMKDSVLYLGDTSLSGAAGYLAGLMTHWKMKFDYVPGDVRVSQNSVKTMRSLFIISDYPSRMMKPGVQKMILEQVQAGAGLLMVGGWESYHGLGGDWDKTEIAAALPVEISRTDDRHNCDQPALAIKVADHPIVGKLPWAKRPPTIGGLNVFKPRKNSQVLLKLQSFRAAQAGGKIKFSPAKAYPLLAIGEFGKGRTAALATDLAPHWVGGFIDWGKKRVKAQARGGCEIEVGCDYAAFIKNLLSWTAKI